MLPVHRNAQLGRGRPYDAMVGLSGGIDSAWLAHLMRAEHGLSVVAPGADEVHEP